LKPCKFNKMSKTTRFDYKKPSKIEFNCKKRVFKEFVDL
jgi:hypothetical protein